MSAFWTSTFVGGRALNPFDKEVRGRIRRDVERFVDSQWARVISVMWFPINKVCWTKKLAYSRSLRSNDTSARGRTAGRHETIGRTRISIGSNASNEIEADRGSRCTISFQTFATIAEAWRKFSRGACKWIRKRAVGQRCSRIVGLFRNKIWYRGRDVYFFFLFFFFFSFVPVSDYRAMLTWSKNETIVRRVPYTFSRNLRIILISRISY